MFSIASPAVGYARVSRDDQDPELQLQALRQAGVRTIYQEAASGARWDRTQLQSMLDHLRPGEVVTVWKLDRLSRSLPDLLTILQRVQDKGAHFRSLTEAIDTTTPAGRMMFAMIGAFAEFERAMLRERTNAGLRAAKARGTRLGPPIKVTPDKLMAARKLLEEGNTQGAVARMLGISPAALSRGLRKVHP
jgi:DNA invertase Pin-like site-specific DNA recombinase